VHTVTDTYTIDMRFPTTYPDQQALQAFLTQQRDDFVDFVSERPRSGVPFALDAQSKTYRAGTSTAGTESLVFTVYSQSGAAHPVTSYHSFTYDLTKKAPVTFESLFKPGTKPVAVLDPLVSRSLADRRADSVAQVGDNTVGARMYEDFALTNDSVIFFLSQGLWLPQAAGPQEVRIPRAALESILA
jgi:hypothetical protein